MFKSNGKKFKNIKFKLRQYTMELTPILVVIQYTVDPFTVYQLRLKALYLLWNTRKIRKIRKKFEKLEKCIE